MGGRAGLGRRVEFQYLPSCPVLVWAEWTSRVAISTKLFSRFMDDVLVVVVYMALKDGQHKGLISKVFDAMLEDEACKSFLLSN